MANVLGIDIVGGFYSDRTVEDIIYRLTQKPSKLPSYHYLIATENVEQLASSSSSSLPNIVVVKDFRKIKSFIEKKRYKAKIGLEVLISDIRYASGLEVGRWFKEIIDLYKFSERYNCQFIISSGATSIWEMISARCFESLLKLCDINSERYWKQLEHWIELHNKLRAA
jgi:hypothetical protein